MEREVGPDPPALPSLGNGVASPHGREAGRDHRRRARPRLRAPRCRHGPVGHPLRRARRADLRARSHCTRLGQRRHRAPRDRCDGRRTGALSAEIKETCEGVARRVATAVGEGYLPLVLGGDHSVALGTLGGNGIRRGPGSGALARCPRRPEHARDDAERQRPRHAAGRGARSDLPRASRARPGRCPRSTPIASR